MQNWPVLFLDTEYTAHEQPQLLSMALVQPTAGSASQPEPLRELYLELDLKSGEGAALAQRCNEFVCQEVLPQFARLPFVVHSKAEMAERLARWFEGWAPQDVFVSYDWSVDMAFLEDLLEQASAYHKGLPRVHPVNLAILNGDDAAERARCDSWRQSMSANGVGRHHALADARALAAAYRSQSNS